jgi:hypothetical protein
MPPPSPSSFCRRSGSQTSGEEVIAPLRPPFEDGLELQTAVDANLGLHCPDALSIGLLRPFRPASSIIRLVALTHLHYPLGHVQLVLVGF